MDIKRNIFETKTKSQWNQPSPYGEDAQLYERVFEGNTHMLGSMKTSNAVKSAPSPRIGEQK